MYRSAAVRAGAALLTLTAAWVAYTQTKQPPRVATTQKVKDDLYMISGEGGNVAVYVTSEGVILVDDMYERNFGQVMEQVKTLSNLPVKYVLNTHQHDDHAGSNAKMLDANAEIIAHRNVRTNMLALKQPGMPRITFSKEMDVNLGGKEVRAGYYGRGHTNGDAVIYFPALKTIHTGDLFLTNAPLPFIDSANGGSVVDWTHTLDEILKIDFDTVIPGHGPLSNREGILKWRADFVKMRDRVSGMVRQKKSRSEVEEVLISEFRWPRGGLALAQLDALMAELKP